MARRQLIALLTLGVITLSGCQARPAVSHQSDALATSANAKRMPRLKRPIEYAAFRGPEHAWIVTGEGDLLRTQDQGESWIKTTAESVDGFERVSFVDTDLGWTINDHGQVWSTRDGGLAWTHIGPRDSRGFLSVDQISFEDKDNGWVVEAFSVWRTTDCGVSWVQKKFDTPLASACFMNGMEPWVFGQANQLFRSPDGGYDWETKSTLPADGDIGGIFCITGSKAWLACGRNRLYKTDDGGTSWQRQLVPGNGTAIRSVYFKNDSDGWAAGSESMGGTAGTEKFKGILLHTVDGGQTWKIDRIGVQDFGYQSVYFADSVHGWLWGFDKIYRTEDGGKRWDVVLHLEEDTSDQ